MSTDVDKLTARLGDDAPCGIDPINEVAFSLIQNAAERRREATDPSGAVNYAKPDWVKVHDLGLRLFEKTRDLRVAVLFCRALVGRFGFAGLRDGLRIVRKLIGTYWQPAADGALPAPGNGVANGVATGGLYPTSEALRREAFRQIADPALIELVAEASKLNEDLQEEVERERMRSEVAEAITELGLLGRFESAPDLEPLRRAVAAAFVQLGGDDAGAGEGETAPGGVVPGQGSAPVGATGGNAAPAGRPSIAGPKDVNAELERLCQYYRKHEPSSPVLILLEFTRSIVDKDLLTIMDKIGLDTLKKLGQS